MEYSKTNKAALIVGGGSGVGGEIANWLLERDQGKKVIIADRHLLTEHDRREGCSYLEIDLAKDDLALLKDLDIDTLIITAGIGRLNFFETFSSAEIDHCFLVNTLAAIKLISFYYDQINSDRDFDTAVVTSITGFVSSPLYSVYSATKGALVKFIEAVNAELEYSGRKNRILNVAPGYIGGTGFHGGGRSEEEQAYLSRLTREIVDAMLQKKEIFIPKEEIYGKVIRSYQEDGAAFARESIAYKLSRNELEEKPKIKIGYLTGTFDLFHVGHLNLLRNAKRYCDKLIVGVHPDGKHKNKEVFIPLEERMEIVRNISYVDDVLVCGSEDTDEYPQLQYDYLFVGTDYMGTERFKRYETYFADKGVKIIYLPYTTKTSSTQLRGILNARLQT